MTTRCLSFFRSTLLLLTLGLTLNTLPAQTGECEFLFDDFSGFSTGDWNLNGGNWQFTNGEIEVNGISGGVMASAEVPFLPWDYYIVDVDVAILNWGPSSGVGLFTYVSGPDTVVGNDRNISGIGPFMQEDGQISLIAFDADQREWFLADGSVDGSGMTSLGLAFGPGSVTLRVNGTSTAVQMLGTFDWLPIDTLRLMAQGTQTAAVFDNLCAETLTEEPSVEQGLSVIKWGEGNGTVHSIPAGIDCGEACSAYFPGGTNVTLTAVPEPGSIFAGWEMDCSGTGDCTLLMSEFKLVIANFEPGEAVDNPPSVTLTSPADGATVSGTTKVSASASDDNGISKVAFYVDGTVKLEDTSAPYEFSWDTTTVANGTHTLGVKAYDTKDQTAEAEVTVSVANGSSEPLEAASTLYFPFCQADSQVYTGFAVSNYSDRPAQLEFTAYGADGSPTYQAARFTLPPHQQLAKLSHEIFGLSAGTAQSSWVEMQTDNPEIGSFFQFGGPSQLDGSMPFDKLHETLYFTRVFDGPSAYRGQPAETWISIANPSGLPVEIELTLVRPTEQAAPPTVRRTIPSKGFLYQNVSSLFGQDRPLAGEYIAAQVIEGAGIVGFELIKLTRQGTVIGLSGQPISGNTELFSAQLASLDSLYTNVKIVNSTPNPVTAHLRASDESAQPLGADVERTIPAGGVLEEDVSNLFGWSESETKIGSLRVESESPGLLGDVVFGDRRGFTTAAALPLQGETLTRGIFSQVANLTGFYTGVALYNPGPETTEVTIDVFSVDGRKTGTKQLTLAPQRRVSRLLTDANMMPSTTGQIRGYVDIRSTDSLIAQQLFGAGSLLSAVPPTNVRWSLVAAGTIGPDGGTVAGEESLQVSVPQGFLNSPSRLAVYVSRESDSSPYDALTSQYKIEGLPKGFTGIIEAVLPIQSDPSGQELFLELDLEATASSRGRVSPVEVLLEDGKAFASILVEAEEAAPSNLPGLKFRAGTTADTAQSDTVQLKVNRGRVLRSGNCEVAPHPTSSQLQIDALKACNDSEKILTNDLKMRWPVRPARSYYSLLRLKQIEVPQADHVLRIDWYKSAREHVGGTNWRRGIWLNSEIDTTDCASQLNLDSCMRASVGKSSVGWALFRQTFGDHEWLEMAAGVWFEHRIAPGFCSAWQTGERTDFPVNGLFNDRGSAAGASMHKRRWLGSGIRYDRRIIYAHGGGAASLMRWLTKKYGDSALGSVLNQLGETRERPSGWDEAFSKGFGSSWKNDWREFVNAFFTPSFNKILEDHLCPPYSDRSNSGARIWAISDLPEIPGAISTSENISMPPLSGNYFRVEFDRKGDTFASLPNATLKATLEDLGEGCEANLYLISGTGTLTVTHLDTLSRNRPTAVTTPLEQLLPLNQKSSITVTYSNTNLNGSCQGELVLALTNLYIASLSTSSGVPGDRVVIKGTGFGKSQGTSSVLFSGQEAKIVSWSEDEIEVEIPNEAPGQSRVVVQVDGVSSNEVPFQVTLAVSLSCANDTWTATVTSPYEAPMTFTWKAGSFLYGTTWIYQKEETHTPVSSSSDTLQYNCFPPTGTTTDDIVVAVIDNLQRSGKAYKTYP